jgi:ribosome-associated protein
MKQDPTTLLQAIAQVIYDKKGTNLLALDLRGVSMITDYVIIAEGGVDRHVIGIADAVLEVAKKEGAGTPYVEGMESGDWVVIDFLDFMIHLFMPGLRDKYRLEELWKEGRILDLNINVKPEYSVPYTRVQSK